VIEPFGNAKPRLAQGAAFPPRSVLLGVPARRVREVTQAEVERIAGTRDDYLELTRAYRGEEP
jgi:carbonic anhydrase/acetyltransferase-like protein (isoleucine patch superfamily)